MGERSVEQIVERCQQGDEQAFGQLYNLMHDRLHRVCRHYTADEQTADDLLHDSFVLIFSKIGTLKDPQKAEAWMTTVTRNLAQTWLQRQQQDATVSLDALQQPIEVAAPMPMAITYDEILHLVDALPNSYRRVFRLSVLEGLSHLEIAALLNIGPHTSSAQLSRAKFLLRRWLGPLVLILVAVLLPLGVWRWAKENKKEEVVVRNEKKGVRSEENVVRRKEEVVRNKENVRCKKEEVLSKKDVEVISVVQDSIVTEPEDTITPKTHTLPMSPTLPMPPVSPCDPTLPQTPISPSDNWTLALTTTAPSGSTSSHLPYADLDTNAEVYDTLTHHRMPLTVGLTLNRRLSPHWQVGLGLQYIRMTSDIEVGNTYARLVQQQRVQYLGVPISVEWHQQLARHLSFYTAANVTLQLPLRSTLDSRYVLSGSATETTTERLHPGILWSAGLGLGLQYHLTPTVGFFVEPRLQHYFQNSSGVDTWQTEHPAVLSVPFGLRITF